MDFNANAFPLLIVLYYTYFWKKGDCIIYSIKMLKLKLEGSFSGNMWAERYLR